MSSGPILLFGGESPLGQRVFAALQANPDTPVLAADGLRAAALRAAARAAVAVVNATMGGANLITATATRVFDLLHAEAPEVHLVHLSSMTVYGDARGWCDESTAAVGAVSRYAAAHIAAEAGARRFPRAVILRPGVEYGPHCAAWSGRVAAWLGQHRIGDLGAGGDGYCNLVYIDDLVQAVLAALSSPPAGGVFNIAMAAPPTWNEYLIAYALALGATPVERMTGWRWGLETRLWAAPLKIAESTLGRLPGLGRHLPPPIPPAFRRLCTQEIRLDVSRAEATWGLQWTALDLGLRAAADCYGPQGSAAGAAK